MNNQLRLFLAALVMTAWTAAAGPSCRADGPYRFLKEIPLGGAGGWDYLSVDSGARRLYVTHASKIVVIDLDQEKVVGEIADTPGVHGLALAPELQRGFSSNGQESKAGIVDLQTLKTLSKVDTDEGPDAILYEPRRQEVYAFNGHGRSATVFAAATGQVVATIPLPGKPEFAVANPKAGRVYANIEDRNEVAAIDTATHRVVDTWPTAPGEEPAGLAIDPARHRLFVGCHNRLLVMMDGTTGKVLDQAPIGQGVDANAFDPRTQFVFSSNGDGTVTILREEQPDRLAPVQTLITQRGARTMALDPKTHKLYLASAKFEPAPAATTDAPRPRPKILPDSFTILVYGR